MSNLKIDIVVIIIYVIRTLSLNLKVFLNALGVWYEASLFFEFSCNNNENDDGT